MAPRKHSAYAAIESDQIEFGPHGTFHIARKVTKSQRRDASRLSRHLQQLRALGEAQETLADYETSADERATAEATVEAMTPHLESLRDQIGEDGDTYDAAAYLLCHIIVMSLEDVAADLADALYSDYDSDVLGIDQLTATAEYIDGVHERRSKSK